MENILPLVPALIAAVMVAVKVFAHKPISWKLALAPLALYALPVLMQLALVFVILAWMLRLLCRIPGMKLLLGVPAAAMTAALAGAVVWARQLVKSLK